MPNADRVLITGGAGFIGSHLADQLLDAGYHVRVLDSLDAQVHGAMGAPRPGYLADDVELMIGDIRDPDAVRKAVDGVDVVCHLAAAVGVGQSMYEIARYTEINNLGTAVLLEALLSHPVRRLLVASSMSVYGEGLYRHAGVTVQPSPRPVEQLRRGHWNLLGDDGLPLEPVPTPESKSAAPESVYALSKLDQERLCLIVGRAYDIPVVALRFFNVYGERQALSNPYTGVLAIFAARYLHGRAPLIFEDGQQRRDFIHVRDLARACLLAVQAPHVRDVVLNVGSGEGYTILDLAHRLGQVMGRPDIEPILTGRYRAGDIRHCFADITHARALLGFAPRVMLDEGLAGLATWLAHTVDASAVDDRAESAARELESRGLVA